MHRFSKRATKKSLRKRTNKKGSRKIRKIRKKKGGKPDLSMYNTALPSLPPKKKAQQQTAPKTNFLAQNKSSVTYQSNQNVEQAASEAAEKSRAQAAALKRRDELLEEKYLKDGLKNRPVWKSKAELLAAAELVDRDWVESRKRRPCRDENGEINKWDDGNGGWYTTC